MARYPALARPAKRDCRLGSEAKRFCCCCCWAEVVVYWVEVGWAVGCDGRSVESLRRLRLDED